MYDNTSGHAIEQNFGFATRVYDEAVDMNQFWKCHFDLGSGNARLQINLKRKCFRDFIIYSRATPIFATVKNRSFSFLFLLVSSPFLSAVPESGFSPEPEPPAVPK